MAGYIDYNTQMRALATSDFAKDFFKLMNNSVFGKGQENLRNRMTVEIITDESIAKKRVCKPSMKRCYILREDLVVLENQITSLELNRPVYTGATVLDLSKLWMYQFHYGKMRKWFQQIELCHSDTDSLLYNITGGSDVYQVMKEHSDDFDFSEYPTDHICYDTRNKKKIGLFTDELNSLCLEEFIGLRPKCYSLKFRGKVKNNRLVNILNREKQVAKGTKKSVKDRHLRHIHYEKVLEELEKIYVKQNVIQSRQHSLGTYNQCRVSLTAFDTKRWIQSDGIHTLAHGHYLTR